MDTAEEVRTQRGRGANTRGRLMRAARTLFSARNVDSITVSDVIKAAGVAKGTFYSYFEHLDDLWAALAEDLAREVENVLQPRRIATDDPVERIATGCSTFLNQAFHRPASGAALARAVWTFPAVASVARKHASEDLQLAVKQGRIAPISIELGLSIVLGVVLETLRSVSEQKLSPSDVPGAVRATLRALGVAPREAEHVVRRASEVTYAKSSLAFSLPSESRT